MHARHTDEPAIQMDLNFPLNLGTQADEVQEVDLTWLSGFKSISAVVRRASTAVHPHLVDSAS
jgi:hypothetical protein